MEPGSRVLRLVYSQTSLIIQPVSLYTNNVDDICYWGKIRIRALFQILFKSYPTVLFLTFYLTFMQRYLVLENFKTFISSENVILA